MLRFFLFLVIIDMTLLINKHFFSNDNILSSVAGLQISLTTIALIVLYILWWGEIITKTAKKSSFFPKITIVALGYILSCLSSIFNSPSVPMSVFSMFFLVQMFMVYFYIVNYIKSKNDIIFILNVLLACLFVQSAVILIENGAKIHFSFTKGVSSGFVFAYSHGGKTIDVYRPAGTGDDPNAAGGQISMLLPIIFSLILYTKNHFKNIAVWIVLLMSIAALILTFSRGSWVGFAVGMIVFLLVALRHRWISGKKIVLGIVLSAIVLSAFAVPITARLSQDDRGSGYARVPLMKLASNMFEEHPFIGIGTNNFGIVLPQYLSSEIRGEWLHIVHNQYLLVLAETGVIGLSFWLLIMAIVIHACLRCIKYNDPFISPLLTGILSGVVAFSIFMAVELSISRLILQLFWIMVSIVMASERLIKINRQQFLNLLTPRKVESLIYERGFIAHKSG